MATPRRRRSPMRVTRRSTESPNSELGGARMAEVGGTSCGGGARAVRGRGACEDPRQRALGGTILANERVDLAGSQRKMGVAQRAHSAVMLRDVFRLEDVFDAASIDEL